MNRLKLVFASSIASIVAVLFVVVVTIWAELAAPFKDALKNLSGHHWITKSIGVMLIYLIVFAAIVFLRKEVRPETARRSVGWLMWMSVIGILAIFLFYAWHYFAA